MYPFQPTGGSVELSVTTSTGRVALPNGERDSVRVSNKSGGSIAYIRFGGSSIEAASATGMDLEPGASEVFRVPHNATHLAAITASGTATVRVTPGVGGV